MDFDLNVYQSFVSELLASGYSAKSFASPDAHSLDAPNLFLRHDVDMDPGAALQMARAENEIGARSTYYLLLSNRHTNPFDIDFRKSVEELVDLGHWIGLHFDASQYRLTAESEGFAEKVRYEAALLSQTCGVAVESVSFHRPSRDLIGAQRSLTHPFVHTYEDFFVRQIEYCSDSSGRWAYGPPNERSAIRDLLPFHLLTHPISWGANSQSPQERIANWIVHRANEDFAYELPDEPSPFRKLL